MRDELERYLDERFVFSGGDPARADELSDRTAQRLSEENDPSARACERSTAVDAVVLRNRTAVG